MFERYSYYFILFEVLFDFLSNDEFKFVKSVGKVVCRHGDDAPVRAHVPPSAAGGDLFWAGVRDLRDHLCCASLMQFNTS